jgi:hypothetical protein
VHRAIAETALDLAGKVVLTEAATGAYVATPVIAAMAGPKRVYAFSRPTSYGSVEEVAALIGDLAAFCGVSDRITVVEKLTPEILGSTDVVTNSGHLRPLNSDFVDQLPSRAVIALMYEAWEFRSSLSALGPEPIVRLQTGGLAAAEWIMRGGTASQGGLSQLVELPL